MLICIGLLSFFFLMNHKTADNMTEQPPSLNLEPEATQDSGSKNESALSAGNEGSGEGQETNIHKEENNVESRIIKEPIPEIPSKSEANAPAEDSHDEEIKEHIDGLKNNTARKYPLAVGESPDEADSLYNQFIYILHSRVRMALKDIRDTKLSQIREQRMNQRLNPLSHERESELFDKDMVTRDVIHRLGIIPKQIPIDTVRKIIHYYPRFFGYL